MNPSKFKTQITSAAAAEPSPQEVGPCLQSDITSNMEHGAIKNIILAFELQRQREACPWINIKNDQMMPAVRLSSN